MGRTCAAVEPSSTSQCSQFPLVCALTDSSVLRRISAGGLKTGVTIDRRGSLTSSTDEAAHPTVRGKCLDRRSVRLRRDHVLVLACRVSFPASIAR